MVCSLGIQDAAKWQFWRKSQRPFKIWALAISSSALGPWPRPREIMSRCSVLPRSSLANLRSWVPGSEPVTIQQWHQVDYIGKELCTLYAPNQDTMIFLSGMTCTMSVYMFRYHLCPWGIPVWAKCLIESTALLKLHDYDKRKFSVTINRIL